MSNNNATPTLTKEEKAEIKELLLGFIRKVCGEEIRMYSEIEMLPNIVTVLMQFFDPWELPPIGHKAKDSN